MRLIQLLRRAGSCAGAGLLAWGTPARAAGPISAKEPVAEASYPRATHSDLEVQIALAREGFSCGSIDGVLGAQTAAALLAFQRRESLAPTARVDRLTRARLILATAPLVEVVLTAEDLAALQPLSTTWLGKSGQTALAHETALEMIAERAHASPKLIRRLNPAIDWDQPAAGVRVWVPAVAGRSAPGKVAKLHVKLALRVLQACDGDDRVIAHFPVSIASRVEKRPVGELRVTVVIANPDYTFKPEVFPESEEARTLGRNLLLPPGPNNPVGLAWIGLDLPGYGIHGTPLPENVGRTESHGCFRLANWDAEALAKLVTVGTPVVVEP